MADDDDYLSELTDEYAENNGKSTSSPSKKTRTGKKISMSNYKMKGALLAPRATTYNAQHIFGEY